jgi:hypothetical protein
MNNNKPPADQGPIELFSKLALVGKHVLVRCAGFRCLDYRDADGNWGDSHRGDILPNVIEILSDP